jgi:hypothetical protein
MKAMVDRDALRRRPSQATGGYEKCFRSGIETCHMKKLALSIAIAISCSAHCREARAVTLTNYPSWDGATHATSWGVSPHTMTFGQTFRAGTGQSGDGMSAPILESAFFQIQNLTDDHQAITFNAYLYQWNGSSIVGPSLAQPWNASVLSSSGYQNVGASFGPVTLVPGLDYIVFFSTIGNEAYNSSDQVANWGGLTTGVVANSGFFYHNGTNFSDLFEPWSSSTTIAELAFSLHFQSIAVPETGSGLFELLGAISFLCILLRK